jgi:hypothetical protein
MAGDFPPSPWWTDGRARGPRDPPCEADQLENRQSTGKVGGIRRVRPGDVHGELSDFMAIELVLVAGVEPALGRF